MDQGLHGKLALVTGRYAGIGYAIAEALVREGARVVINGRSRESVDAAVARLNAAAVGEAVGFAGEMRYSGSGRRPGAPVPGGGNPGEQPRDFPAGGVRRHQG